MKKLKRVLPLLTVLLAGLLLTGCESEMGQKMTNAALNTLMGVAIVFIVLIIISLVISSFSLIHKFEEKRNQRAEKDLPVKPEVPEGPSGEEDETDDLELVAVIAAAIAAYEGTAPEGIQVRSIRRVSGAKQWKRG